MFVNIISSPKSLLFLFFFFNVIIQNVTANPHETLPQNKFKCVRFNEPPYFYCNLFDENLKTRNDEIGVRIIPKNEKDPFYPSEATPTTISAPLTASTLVSKKNIEIPETTSDSVELKESSLKFKNEFSTTEKSHIFTSTTTATSGFTADTFLSAENSRTITTATTLKSPKDEDFIISELIQPLKQPKGPTIMEEIFIDTLTKSQHPQQQNHEKEAATLFEPFHNELLMHSNRHLFILCRRFLPFARAHCHREWTQPNFVEKCRGYFQDCNRFITRADSLQEAARALQMNVRYGNHEFPFQTLPKYF